MILGLFLGGCATKLSGQKFSYSGRVKGPLYENFCPSYFRYRSFGGEVPYSFRIMRHVISLDILPFFFFDKVSGYNIYIMASLYLVCALRAVSCSERS